MNDIKYVLSISVPFVVGILSYLTSLNVAYGILLSIIAFLVFIIVLIYSSYYKMAKEQLVEKDKKTLLNSFLENVYTHRGALQKEEEIRMISEARRDVKVLGISHRTLWADTEEFLNSLIEAGNKNVKITFLILDPSGKNLVPKAKDEYDNPDNWKNEINSSINRFKRLKKDHPTMNLELFAYDVFPIWHMVIIDDSTGLIGYYPTGKTGSSSPLYLIKKGDLSILTSFIKYFGTLRSQGIRIIPTEDSE
jgi:hypothetical protein